MRSIGLTLQNSYFSNKQYVLQLLKIMDDWTAQLDSGGQVDVIYTDFAKAFDTVSHHIKDYYSK